MATDRVRTRSRERLERLCASSASVEDLEREVVQLLRRVIGFERWCWSEADPRTLLPGTGLAEHDYGPQLPRALEHEYSGSDVATKEHVGRGPTPALSLSTTTQMDLARSPRWDEVLRGVGIGDVAVLACRDRWGCWGWLELYRDRGTHPFTSEDLGLLADVAPHLGSLLRRGVRGRHPLPSEVVGSGVLLLGPDLRLLGQTESARARVAAMPAAAMFAGWGILPPAVYAAATRARAGPEAGARVLGRSATGEWVQIEAARVTETSDVAITIRAATPLEVGELVARAYGLTDRERQLVARLGVGDDTDDIARSLSISPWTVQDHLKSVFAKLGVHSRAEVSAVLAGTPANGVESPSASLGTAGASVGPSA